MIKKIEGVYRSDDFHWVGDGFHVTNYFPSAHDIQAKISPFLLFDYGAPHRFEPTDTQRGVGPHPHRGFETVTIAFEGSVAHHDSTGNSGIIGPGDVQWMTAGSGILHKEYHSKDFSKKGGIMHMMQIWVNLPQKDKMTPPRYQPILASEISEVKLSNNGGVVRIIAGEFQGAKGPAKTYSPISLFDIRLHPAGRCELTIPETENAALMVLGGEMQINGKKCTARDLVLFQNSGETILIEAESEAHLMLLGGEPTGGPIVQYGPFVMNTQQEIRQAIADFNAGKFGILED